MSDRIVFVSSNGTGLGHLTRSLAIARRLEPSLEPLFITLSAAAPVVREMGFPVEYIASYGTPGAGNDWRWSRRLRARLRDALAEAEPAAIVFDGTHPYEAVLGALRTAAGAATVWCRRPLWKAGVDRAPLARSGAFDAILEPGELAADEDRGPTVARRGEAHAVAPIVLLDRGELLSRAKAEQELGLAPGRTNVLVALGQGAEVRAATARSLDHLAARGDVQVAALSSALAGLDSVPDGVIQLEATYPMSRYYTAFDAAIAAAGYNVFHELIHLGVPSLFVPMHRETDDQPARARFAAAREAALAVDSPSDPRVTEQLDELLQAAVRADLREGMERLRFSNGAAEAARWLADLASTVETEVAGDMHGFPRSRRDFTRRWGQFIRYAPRTAVRLGHQTLTQPRPRTLVLAVGLEGEELEPAVAEALKQTPDPPPSVLVVTDAIADLGRLRALGVGVEHVPARGSRQAELAGGDYDDFLRGRLGSILAERPRPRRVLVAAGGREPPPGSLGAS